MRGNVITAAVRRKGYMNSDSGWKEGTTSTFQSREDSRAVVTRKPNPNPSGAIKDLPILRPAVLAL